MNETTNTSKPGCTTSEFQLAAFMLVAAILAAATGRMTVVEAADFAKWVFGAYCGARGLSKLGANEVVGGLVSAFTRPAAAPAAPAAPPPADGAPSP